MKNYKNSKTRLGLLLAQFFVILYTLVSGDETARILAIMLLPIMLYSFKTWTEE